MKNILITVSVLVGLGFIASEAIGEVIVEQTTRGRATITVKKHHAQAKKDLKKHAERNIQHEKMQIIRSAIGEKISGGDPCTPGSHDSQSGCVPTQN
jgi:hypothetical protein